MLRERRYNHLIKELNLAVLIALGAVCATLAQESASPTATPSPVPTSPPARNVRISFVPPPIQGKISLGIYDANAKLVRVLQQEAELDEFEVGDDGLSIRWDGKDSDGYDLPAGTYHPRGYVVAPMKIEPVPIDSGILGPPALEAPTRVRLVRNPLEKNATPIVDLDIGYDDENAYLKTTDGLPLVTISNTGDVEYAAFINRSDQTLTILLRRHTEPLLVKVSPISNMMAFDCGEIELK
jgi:hypothetical protein